MRNDFDIPSVNKLKIKSKWKPNKEFHEYITSSLFNLAFSNGYWEIARAVESLVKELSYEQIAYLWNEYPKLRPKVAEFLHQNASDTYDDTYYKLRRDILNLVLGAIPVDVDLDNNKIRALINNAITYDFDYLNELTNARISADNDLISLWERHGLSNSKDPAFYDAIFFSIKRARGSVDRKISVIDSMFSQDVLSDRILKEMAKSGTKNIKRVVVSKLCDMINNLEYKIRWNKVTEAQKESISSEIAALEERALLYASSDDYTVVAHLANALSCENLPWIMPSASKFPRIMRDIQYKIDESS